MHIKTSTKRASQLYLLNTALLATHEIDSAYWQEWQLFRLPGGITLFLIVNFVLLWIVIFGFSRVVVWAPSARWFSFALAAAGIFAFSIHTIFLLLGHNEFRAPISIGLLGLILLVSLSQVAVVFSLSTHQKPDE
ncbi:MAG: hypothetical protein OEM99_17200 [Gammaproteobacteria bacterium]|nr:hypothetical protein [Gammaproteobacteria bacterium]